MAFENVSIKNAIIKLQKRRIEIDNAVDDAVKVCAERGVQIAKEQLHSYEFQNFPREIAQSLKSEKISQNHYQISADGGAAIYVEYGTGIVGKSNPHPNMAEKNVEYDRNQHGEKGWLYPKKDGSIGFTKGQTSKPFMYNTANQLTEEIPQIIKQYLEVK